MALSYAHGAVQWLAADAATTTYPVSGLGFTPKALRFFCVGLQSGTDAASQTVHWRASVGMAVSATNRACMGSQSQDAAGTQVCTTGYRNDAVVVTMTSTPAVDGLLDLSSIDSDGFTLVVDDQVPVNITVMWEAWGGTDIDDVALIEIAEPAATGSVNYFTGFRPSVVMFAGVQGTAAANTVTRNDAALMVGAASGPLSTQQWVAWANDDDASTTSDTDRYGLAGECLSLCAVAGGNPSSRASLTALRPDGFTLNWIARATSDRRYLAFAIKGGVWHAGSFTIAGNSGSATATVITTTQGGQAFQPVGLSLAGVRNTQSSAGTSATEGIIGIGMARTTSSRQAMAVWSENAKGTAAEIDTTLEYDAMLSFPSNAGAADNAIDLNAVNSNGFQAIVDTAGAGVANEWVGYLACGNQTTEPTLAWNNFLGVNSQSPVSLSQ